MTVARRIVPCLDVRDGRVVKGVRFRDHVDMGDIRELAMTYSAEGADELVFYDITASPQGRSVDVDWVEQVARVIDIPFAVAGGIGSSRQAQAILAAGADKISINTPALLSPDLIDELALRYGSQCVVVGIDSEYVDGQWRVRQFTGDPDATADSGRNTRQWLEEAVDRGAGEIVLNCMNSDGVRGGYDIEQLSALRERCSVPLIASGGAGTMEHFAEVFEQADVDAALAATVFHSGQIRIADLKDYLVGKGINVRPMERPAA